MAKEDKDFQIDLAVYRKSSGLTERQQKTMQRVAGTTWARQILRKNKKVRDKLLTKIKNGVKQGKYKDTGLEVKGAFPFAEPKVKKTKKGKGKKKTGIPKKEQKEQRFKEPEQKKGKTPVISTKKQLKQAKPKSSKGIKITEPRAPKKIVRKISEQRKMSSEFAPSGRRYSKTEIHEGVSSKRAYAYRQKHGIDKNDFEKV